MITQKICSLSDFKTASSAVGISGPSTVLGVNTAARKHAHSPLYSFTHLFLHLLSTSILIVYGVHTLNYSRPQSCYVIFLFESFLFAGEHPAAMQHNSSSMYSGNFYCSICCMLFTIFTCCLQHFLATTTAAATLLTVTTKGTSKCSRSNKNNNNDDGGSECKTPTSAAQSTARATDDYRCVSIRSCNNRHYQRHSRSRSCSRSPRRISISGATARSSHATRALSEITR